MTPEPPSSPPSPTTHSHDRVLAWFAIVVGLLLAASIYAPRMMTKPTQAMTSPYRVDVNHAGKSELMQVPGVGPGRADAIIAKRTELGSFGANGDITTVKGIGVKTADGIKSFILTEPTPASPNTAKLKPGDPPIDINTCSEIDLMRLPAIGSAMANRIIAARPFVSVDDLRRVSGIGVKTLEKLKPFVKVEMP